MGDAKTGASSPKHEPTRMESAEEVRRAQAASGPSGTVLEAPPQSGAAPAHPGTRLESVDDIRKAMAQPRTPTRIANAAPLAREATRLESAEEIRALAAKAAASPAAVNDTLLFRPARRPPSATLVIYDDGKSDGERVRLRAERTVIGRIDGDVRIPHDGLMSTRHAEIVRESNEGRWRWVLVDMQSTNGTFVRVPNSPLKHKAEVLVGSTVLRFEDAALNLPGADSNSSAALPTKTQGWQALAATDLKPSLVQVLPQGLGKRYFLDAADNAIGRDAAQAVIVLGDDVQLDPRHARVVRDGKGDWSIVDASSLNGVWLRIDRYEIASACEFQLGEQRFAVQT